MSSIKRQAGAALAVIALVVSTVAAVSVLAVAPAAADDHTWDDAPDLTERGNFTVNLPYPSDHYPGDTNEANGSIEYFASGGEAYNYLGAEDGVWMKTVILKADWIDYSACSTENTGAFGLDRGNNNSGTRTDESLLEHYRDDEFHDNGLDVFFYRWKDLGGDPPYMAPGDAIIAAQGQDEGPCLTMTSDPGWYQLQGFLNGTIADGDCTEEGNSDCKPEEEEVVGVRLKSNYIYVCECDSEQEAREELGPPPNEEGPTPTPGSGTPTPTSTADGSDADADESTPTPTETPPPDDGTPTPTETPTPTQADANDGGGGGDTGGTATDDDTGDDDTGDDGGTPTVGGGPGFTPVVAILALLGAAVLALRRR